MKYLITESQAKIAAAFLKLDMKNFIQIKKDGDIYFVYSEGDKYAQIVYDNINRICFINFDLIKEISAILSLREYDSEQTVRKWVENTLQIKFWEIMVLTAPMRHHLMRVPSK